MVRAAVLPSARLLLDMICHGHRNIETNCLSMNFGKTSYCTELLNVFETFLPQLLMYPNPADPLNGEAAALLMNTPEEYKARVRGESGPECCCN